MTQASLTRLEKKLGFDSHLKLHSPRNWFPTAANQLLMEPDKREHLGRWKKGSVMPELYDKTVCVTELAIRNQILDKIDQGWLPCASFEIPKQVGNQKECELESLNSESSAGETSVTPTASFLKKEVDISQLDED